jgi:hypothetical protein
VLRAVVVAHDAAIGVERDQVFRIDVDEFGGWAQLENPVLPVPAQETGVFDAARVGAHEVQREHLAVLRLRRTKRGNVEDRVELAVRVE